MSEGDSARVRVLGVGVVVSLLVGLVCDGNPAVLNQREAGVGEVGGGGSVIPRNVGRK